MRQKYFFLALLILITSCNEHKDKNELKKQILTTEKSFEKMVADKGIAFAFYYYADEQAVIKRENDSLVKGNNNIKNYYSKMTNKNISLKWTPDFIDVSDCGTLGYTYGKYIFKVTKKNGDTVEYKGIFHTVWKRQKDNCWKYVWD